MFNRCFQLSRKWPDSASGSENNSTWSSHGRSKKKCKMDNSERAAAHGTMARCLVFQLKTRCKPEQLAASGGLPPYLYNFCGHVCPRKFTFDFMSANALLKKHTICSPVWKKFHIHISSGCRHLHNCVKLLWNKAAVLHYMQCSLKLHAIIITGRGNRGHNMPQHRWYICVYGEVSNCSTIQGHCHIRFLILCSHNIRFVWVLSDHPKGLWFMLH